MSYALRRLDGRFAVVPLAPHATLPEWFAWQGPLTSVTRTAEECSLILDERQVPASVAAQRGFVAYTVVGPLPFNVVGVLAALASALASAGVSLLTVSTHDTDIILVSESQAARAEAAWRNSGHQLR